MDYTTPCDIVVSRFVCILDCKSLGAAELKVRLHPNHRWGCASTKRINGRGGASAIS